MLSSKILTSKIPPNATTDKRLTSGGADSIPYEKIAQLAEQGFGALEIAKKTNRLIKGDDPAHSIRAILSKMRTSGFKNKDGKIVKLKVKRVGFEPKPKKATVKKTVVAVDGKTLAAGGGK